MQNPKKKFCYKLVVSYLGTKYSGWVQQPNKPSVLGEIMHVFSKTFNRQGLFLGASKTDAGVHAHGQLVRLETDLFIDPPKLIFALNNALPEDINIVDCKRVSKDFHPHHNVESKEYWYHVSDIRPSPFLSYYVTLSEKKIDYKRLKDALMLFIGTYDFSLFYTGNDRVDTKRTIDKISLEYCSAFNGYRIKIIGKKFLRHMIRRIVGAALWYATENKNSLHIIKETLEANKHSTQLPTAPAKGLILHQIVYKDLSHETTV